MAELEERDYELKLEYLAKQYDRLWARFNYFLTIELALFGYAGYLAFDAKVPAASSGAILLGTLVSALWYAVGAQDRALVEVYRGRTDEAAARVYARLYRRSHVSAAVEGCFFGLRSWYWPPLSITKLPATVAICVLTLWLFILAYMIGSDWELPRSWRVRDEVTILTAEQRPCCQPPVPGVP